MVQAITDILEPCADVLTVSGTDRQCAFKISAGDIRRIRHAAPNAAHVARTITAIQR
jgi:hypothetical protein